MSLSEPVFKSTARQYLKKLGYEYAIKIKKQWLSAKHRKARIQWCERYQHWTFQAWRKATFSNESTFYVLKQKNQVKIWRANDERLLPDYTQQMNTENGGGIGIWSSISVGGNDNTTNF